MAQPDSTYCGMFFAGLLSLIVSVGPVTAAQVKTAKNGVTLEATYPPEVSVGDAIPMSFRLVNATAKAIRFRETDGFQELHIKVVNSKGEVFTSGNQIGAVWTNRACLLESGQTKEFKVDLVKYLKLSPEKYMMSGSIEINPRTRDPFLVAIQGVTFAVVSRPRG